MNVDIKNALDKLLTACDYIQSAAPQGSNAKNIRNIVIADIFCFIDAISVEKAHERMRNFAKNYLDGTVLTEPTGALPILCQVDNSNSAKQGIKTSTLFVSFLFELGRYYSLSKVDKRDIDVTKFAMHIKQLNDYISANSISMPPKPEPAAAEVKRKELETVVQTENTPNDLTQNTEPEESLDELLAQLNSLIGLTGVKQEVNSLINLLKMKQLRDARGLKTPNVSKHLVFLGNPGTGKTTVARLLSKIYKQMGVLEKGQLIEVDRGGLVAGYVGQTAIKTQERIDEAMGGVLFIDEAYTLAKGGADFGQEAIDTLLKAMEDKRDNFVVVVAGYSAPMATFLESNPGLKSRFNKNIVFEDYSQDELLAIFKVFCTPYGMELTADIKRLRGAKCNTKIGKILFQIKNPDTGVVVQDQRVGGNKGAVCIVPWNEMRQKLISQKVAVVVSHFISDRLEVVVVIMDSVQKIQLVLPQCPEHRRECISGLACVTCTREQVHHPLLMEILIIQLECQSVDRVMEDIQIELKTAPDDEHDIRSELFFQRLKIAVGANGDRIIHPCLQGRACCNKVLFFFFVFGIHFA